MKIALHLIPYGLKGKTCATINGLNNHKKIGLRKESRKKLENYNGIPKAAESGPEKRILERACEVEVKGAFAIFVHDFENLIAVRLKAGSAGDHVSHDEVRLKVEQIVGFPFTRRIG